jgi:hypothetical protein
MSVMAHMLEEPGLPTRVLALVLPQVEKTCPPRALMTPQALRLLERTDGPVLLEHFPDDDPSWLDRPDWVPAVSLPDMPRRTARK